jgi:hypothetical protein
MMPNIMLFHLCQKYGLMAQEDTTDQKFDRYMYYTYNMDIRYDLNLFQLIC